nr:MAG TPA: hypothetical protein [Caudoviricetes sp.]
MQSLQVQCRRLRGRRLAVGRFLIYDEPTEVKNL